MKRLLLSLALILAASEFGWSQNSTTPPQTLQETVVSNLGDASVLANVFDNRSTVIRHYDSHGYCGVGSGAWSITLQFSDVSATGPWTSFGSGGVVTNASSNCLGFGFGYHPWISFAVTGTATATYTGWKSFYTASAAAGAGPTFPITPAQGGTGAANAATSGRFLRADGTNFVTSLVAAAGAGVCTNQFVRAAVDNAIPNCSSVAGTDFANQTANQFLGGPTTGAAAAPTFRSLVLADLPSGAGQVSSVGVVMPGEFAVANSPITGAGNITITRTTQTANFVMAGPSGGGPLAPFFRPLVAADMPVNTGTVTNLTVGNLSPLFTSSVATSSTTPALTFSLSTQTANRVFVGPASAGPSAPTFRSLVKADQVSTTVYTDQSNTYTTGTQDFRTATAVIPNTIAASAPGTCTEGQQYGDTTSKHMNYCGPDNTWTDYFPTNPLTLANEAGTGTTIHKLVKLTGAPSTGIIVATTDLNGVVGICTAGCGTSGNASIQRSGSVTCVFDGATTAGDYVIISRSVTGDCSDGGATFPGSGTQVIGRVLSTNGGAGTYTIDLAQSESRGNVSSVGLAMPTNEFAVANSPVTGAATLTVSKKTQVKNTVWAGPTSGADAAPTFRTAIAADFGASITARTNLGNATAAAAAPTFSTTVDALAYQVAEIPQIAFVTADFTTANNANLQNITGLSWTIPASTALNIPFSCRLMWSQATAAVLVSFGIQDVTVAPTQINALGTMQTNTTAFTGGNLTGLTTTTATAIVSATPSATTTVWNADLSGFIEAPSNAASSAINIMVQTAAGADAVTVKRGSFCKVF